MNTYFGSGAEKRTLVVCNGWIGTIRGITVYGHTDGSVRPYYFGEQPSEEQQAADQKELDRIREEIRRDEVKAAIEAEAEKAHQYALGYVPQQEQKQPDEKPIERKEMKYLTSNLWESYQVECPVLSKIPFVGRYAFASFVQGYFEHKRPFSGEQTAGNKAEEKKQEPVVLTTKTKPHPDPFVYAGYVAASSGCCGVTTSADINWFRKPINTPADLYVDCGSGLVRKVGTIESLDDDFHQIKWDGHIREGASLLANQSVLEVKT